MPKERWRVLSNPSASEMDAQRVEIECVEPPKGSQGAGYVVTVTPKTKETAPGKTQKEPPYAYTNPVKRVFKSPKEVLDYLDTIL